jgi:hypothetical protein
LLVHAIVIFGPVAALAVIAYAVAPRWRVALRWPAAVLAVLAAGAAIAAEQSGERLAGRMGLDLEPAGGEVPDTLQVVIDHSNAGETAVIVNIVFAVVTVLAVFIALPARGTARLSRPWRAAIAGVLVVVSVAALVTVVLAGHSGAEAVWSYLM